MATCQSRPSHADGTEAADNGLLSTHKPLLCYANEYDSESCCMVTNNGDVVEKQHVDGTSLLRTCFNGVNALSGVGILSIPYALSKGGWLSMIVLAAVATICCYTGILLRRCMDTDQPVKSYPDIGELAFGSKGRLVIATFMYLELYLVAVEFLILEGDNFEKLFPNAGSEVLGIKIGAKQEFVLIAALIILPTMWLRNLALLSYVSVGGVVVSAVLAAAVLWAGVVDGVGFHEKGRLFSLNGLPTAISMYSFCYCGHAVFPTIYTSMKNKANFTKVLVICFGICTINYVAMAIAGYLMYGEELSSQITLNLPVGKPSSIVAIYMTLFNPFTKYALMVTPIASAIETYWAVDNSKAMSISIRSLLVASTVVIALTIPFFGYLMALVGSFLSCTVSMLLPCICYLKIAQRSQRCMFEAVVIWGIMVIGALVAVLGTYTSIKDIKNSL